MVRGTAVLPEIASFWYGSDLTWLERLCIQSFLDRGHAFTLYAEDGILGVPPGTRHAHPREIFWPPPFDITGNGRLAVAAFSDIFRLEMLAAREVIWVDLDAYCLRPFAFPSPYVFTRTPEGAYPNGVLGLPGDSQVLAQMRAFVTGPNPTQPWRGRKLRRRNAERLARGESWGIQDLAWGCSGPKALQYFMTRSPEDRHALPHAALYGLAVADLWKLHAPGLPPQEIETEAVFSVHVYGHQKKALALHHGGLPVPGSYLDHLCRRHGIVPEAAPIAPLVWMQKAGAEDDEAAAAEEEG